MTTYRLPEILGGGEFEPCADEPDYPKVGFDLPGVSGILWLDRVDLTEVVPPLLEPPPVGSFVYAGSLVLQRRDDAGIDWWEYQGKCWLTWAQVCELGTPVRLVPAPVVEPVALPWEGQWEAKDHEGERAEVDTSSVFPGCVFVASAGAHLAPDTADAMAAALTTAAAKARQS